MEEKLRFVFSYERDEESMSELCHSYGISRETGYVWLRRYRQLGVEGLVELHRACRSHPNRSSAAVEQAVLALREAHMSWGPRKLKRVLERDQPGRRWPATSTIGEMVKRAGLVVARPKRRRTEPYTQPLEHALESNRVWCADFKGWFRTGDGDRIDPLTVSDAFSRYLLRCQAVEKTDTQRVRAIFEAAFREHGLPAAIRTDNGAPFASSAIGGLSRLAVWWIKLGILPERIQAGHPEQNGRHERMHRTLKQDCAAAADRWAQQRELDRFRHEFNQVRPHEALGMQTPASVYQTSPRQYPRQTPEPDYPDSMRVLTVKSHGHFRWNQRDVFLSEVLWGERIGLHEVDDGRFIVYFAHLPLARFEARTCKLAPLKPPPASSAPWGWGQACPQPQGKTKNLPEKEKVSDMCPV